jgi:hypothetical protein
MRVALKCLVALTGIALAVSILLSSNRLAPKLQTPAIPRFFAQPFAYPGSGGAHIRGNSNLLFDPVLVYSTFLGGPNVAGQSGPSLLPQSATVLFVDGSGNAYVAGTTNSPSFPVTPGVVQSSNPQGY